MNHSPYRVQFVFDAFALTLFFVFASTSSFGQHLQWDDSEEGQFMKQAYETAMRAKAEAVYELIREESERDKQMLAEWEIKMKSVQLDELKSRIDQRELEKIMNSRESLEFRVQAMESLIDESFLNVEIAPEYLDLPQGASQGESTPLPEGGYEIITLVRKGNVVKEYKKIISITGVYYLCEDQLIPRDLWEIGVSPRSEN